MKERVLCWHSVFRGWRKRRVLSTVIFLQLFVYYSNKHCHSGKVRTCQLIIWCSFVRLDDLCYFFDEFMAVSHAGWHGDTTCHYWVFRKPTVFPCWSGYRTSVNMWWSSVNSVSLKVLHYRTTCLLAVAMRLLHVWGVNMHHAAPGNNVNDMFWSQW